ncbi:hypothetical protein KM043_000583 [Ampulex compressa]|nr:hypothetical protein KM043_000583 [Ampulex compressa]
MKRPCEATERGGREYVSRIFLPPRSIDDRASCDSIVSSDAFRRDLPGGRSGRCSAILPSIELSIRRDGSGIAEDEPPFGPLIGKAGSSESGWSENSCRFEGNALLGRWHLTGDGGFAEKMLRKSGRFASIGGSLSLAACFAPHSFHLPKHLSRASRR